MKYVATQKNTIRKKGKKYNKSYNELKRSQKI